MAVAALLLLALGASAQRSRLALPALNEHYTVSRLEVHHDPAPPAALKPTQDVVKLTRGTAPSLSSMYVEALRRQTLGQSRVVNGSTPLTAAQAGNVFLAGITVGGQNFSVVIDSGSSDPWLAINGFVCYDPVSGAQVDEETCGFSTPYDPSASSTYRLIDDQNFNISYADGEYVSGGMGYESITMAGITVPNQQFGLVEDAAWYGDGIGSGLVGFAYSSLTSAYAGTDPTQDVAGQTILYNPLFANMYQNQDIPLIFSLVINRDPNNAGILAIGGIPEDVPHSPYFASTNIQPVGINASTGGLVYEFYSIQIGGYAFSSDRNAQFNVYSNNNPLKTSVVGNRSSAVVDSGTSIIYIPDDIAADVNAAFSPPAYYDDTYGAYFVDCDAVAPRFGVVISNKIFYVNPVDLVRQASETLCLSAVQGNGGGLSILGDVFLLNVLAVFDVGAQQMRFAAREFYGL